VTPHVTCVCLTADRQAYTDRAVAGFLAQSYPNKSLLILDNGETPYRWPSNAPGVSVIRYLDIPNKSIGKLRNLANECKPGEIIAHWDSDDYSHPLRLAWQVQRLQEAGDRVGLPKAECVGYRSLLFYRKADSSAWLFTHEKPSYCVGTSLLYWRKTWEAHPFEERNVGEDLIWLRGVKSYGDAGFFKDEPAMVAEVHESNTTKLDHVMVHNPAESWTRKPEWDARLKELMKL
jgi:glycosyltransferase involved in cell wall biosynthesis